MEKEMFKLIRWYLRMNQVQFAEHIGVTYSTVAEIEAGSRRISDNVAGKLAHTFNASDTEFIEYVQRHRAIKELSAL